jgi:hypothetical protein
MPKIAQGRVREKKLKQQELGEQLKMMIMQNMLQTGQTQGLPAFAETMGVQGVQGVPQQPVAEGLVPTGQRIGGTTYGKPTVPKKVTPKGALTEYQKLNIKKEEKSKMLKAVGTIRRKEYYSKGITGESFPVELPTAQDAINVLLSEINVDPFNSPELLKELEKSYPKQGKQIVTDYEEAIKSLLKKGYSRKDALTLIREFNEKQYKELR